MKDVYENIPVLGNEKFCLRGVEAGDREDLLKVYSDVKAVPFFNSDNCHGDDFHYETPERMAQAIDFWLFSYRNRYFVRWAIIDQTTGRAVGTVELFHRDSEDFFNNCGALRLDLRSDFETEAAIISILNLIVPEAYGWFYCDKIAVKAVFAAQERKKALSALGFVKTEEKVTGSDGTQYGDYFVRFRDCAGQTAETAK